MKRSLQTHICVAALLLSSTKSMAEESDAQTPVEFTAIDADRNGVLSLDEMQSGAPRLATRFSELDKNGDGLVSLQEITQSIDRDGVETVQNATLPFNAADADGDGRLSLVEASQGTQQIAAAFARLDADGDGFVTREEILTRERAQK